MESFELRFGAGSLTPKLTGPARGGANVGEIKVVRLERIVGEICGLGPGSSATLDGRPAFALAFKPRRHWFWKKAPLIIARQMAPLPLPGCHTGPWGLAGISAKSLFLLADRRGTQLLTDDENGSFGHCRAAGSGCLPSPWSWNRTAKPARRRAPATLLFLLIYLPTP